jgi:hypothetical protein
LEAKARDSAIPQRAHVFFGEGSGLRYLRSLAANLLDLRSDLSAARRGAAAQPHYGIDVFDWIYSSAATEELQIDAWLCTVHWWAWVKPDSPIHVTPRVMANVGIVEAEHDDPAVLQRPSFSYIPTDVFTMTATTIDLLARSLDLPPGPIWHTRHAKAAQSSLLRVGGGLAPPTLQKVQATQQSATMQNVASAGQASTSVGAPALEVTKVSNQPEANKDLAPSRVKARAVYEWAMGRIEGAERMTIAELLDAARKRLEVEAGKATGAEAEKLAELRADLPSSADTFGKYLRDAGIKQYNAKGERQPGRSVRRARDT